MTSILQTLLRSTLLSFLIIAGSKNSFAQAPANNTCANAILLNSSPTCTTVSGTLLRATTSNSGTCVQANQEVWYKFVAKTTHPVITLSNVGSNFQSALPVIQLFTNCGTTQLNCNYAPLNVSTAASLLNGLTVGATYYIKVTHNGGSGANVSTGNWGFDICITDVSIDYSKSYVNITDGTTGGTINPGDVLEIRATLVVGGEKAVDLTNVKFFDTLRAGGGLNFKDSIALRTNEGKNYKFFTEAPGDDAGWKSTFLFDNTIQMNIGLGASSSTGGVLDAGSRPTFYNNTCIIMATYRVTVSGAYNSTIKFGGGAFRYTIGSKNFTINFPNDSLIVYQTLDACSDAVSPGNLIGNASNGTFGTLPLGSTATAALQNAGPAAINTTYNYTNFAAGKPQDYDYGVTNNTSATNAINRTAPKGDASRVHTVWDITGDHTNAADPIKGNLPCDVTKPVSAANPCGYMLAINAAYRSDVAFEYAVTGACADTYYEVSAWFKNICYKCGCDSTGKGSGSAGYIPTAPGDSSGVRPNIAMQIDGIDYYTTGELPYLGLGSTQTASDTLNSWVRKSFVFKTSSLQTNFKITFRNNAPGGGGNDWVVDDIGLRTCYPTMEYAPPNPITYMGQPLTISDTVRSYFNSYTYYKWQKASALTPTVFIDIVGQSGVAAPAFNALFNQYEYVRSYTIPGSSTAASNAGDRYRMVVASSLANLSNGCNYTPSTAFSLLPTDGPCNFSDTNYAIAPQTGNINWNKLDWSLGHIPTCCESATITYTGKNTSADLVTIDITNDICIINLTLINNSTKPNQLFKTILHPGYNMQMNGHVRMGAPATSATDSCIFIARGGGTITVNGNTVIGYMGDNATSIIGTAPNTTTYANYVLKGDSLTFNTRAFTNDKYTAITLNPTSGTVKFVNNTNAAIYPFAVRFDKLNIGGTTPAIAYCAGTNQNAFVNDNNGFVDVTNGSTLIMPANYSLNAKDFQNAGTFKSDFFLRANATLILGGTTGGIPGSNFPANFVTTNLDRVSTVIFNGAAQTIPGTNNNVNAYGHITLTGTGVKTGSAGVVNIFGNLYRTNTGHTFNANGGRVAFMSSVTGQKYYADNGATPIDFYDFTNNNTFSTGLSLDSSIGIINEFELKPSTKITLNTGNVTLRSSQARTAHVTNLGTSIPGIVYNTTYRFIVERYLYANRAWRFLATPILQNAQDGTTPTIANAWRENAVSLTSNGYGTAITGPTGPNAELDYFSQRGSLKYYDDVNNVWIELANTTSTKLANTKGYMVFVRGDRGALNTTSTYGAPTTLRMKGKIRTANQSFSILANKFQSVGNPYASQINFATLTRTNITNSFIVWNPTLLGLYGVGGYENYSLVGSNYRLNGLAGGRIRNTIESGEAFFIQNNTASAGTLVIKESDKGILSNTVSKNAEIVAKTTLDISLFENDGTGSFVFADGASASFDKDYADNLDNDDVIKLTNTNDNLFIKSNGQTLVVERRSSLKESDTIHLGLTGTRVAEYKFHIDPFLLGSTDLDAYLFDNFLHATTLFNAADSNSIKFNITSNAASKDADRFKIVFKKIPRTIFKKIEATRIADRSVALDWQLLGERNIAAYTIEFSTDSIMFLPLGKQQAIFNNGGEANYTYQDKNASSSRNWYRIKVTSAGADSYYSPVVAVAAIGESKISIYPNPVTNRQLNIQFKNQPLEKHTLQIFDAKGQLTKTSNVRILNLNQTVGIDIGDLAAGTYRLVIVNESKAKQTIQFVTK